MIIIPAEHPLDWHRVPRITLLLIFLNCLIFFGYQSGDPGRRSDAVKQYLEAGLLAREASSFKTYCATHCLFYKDELEAYQNASDEYLATLILYHLEFEDQIHQNAAFQADPQWQAERLKVERSRDLISTYRFGDIAQRLSLKGLFGSMFLHGDFSHLLGNMIFLFIVGFALEVALGRGQFLGLYLLGGIFAGLFDGMIKPDWIPNIGASGAIAALMGMYAGVYGLSKIRFFYWLGPVLGYIKLPALLVLVFWLGKELYGGVLSKERVAFFAHLGGLLFGFGAIALLKFSGRFQVDEAYLSKEDPDASFKKELAEIDALISRLSFDQAVTRGLELQQRHPARLEITKRLYGLAKSCNDQPLQSQLIRHLLHLPPGSGQLLLLQQLTKDISDPNCAVHAPPVEQLRLLQALLKAADSKSALLIWRKLSLLHPPPQHMPALSLALGRLLAREGDRGSLGVVANWLCREYPESEQSRSIELLQTQLEV